ncbi:MAG: Ig-like domain-containing protein [Paludibacteraceae bacterium]|nr:Ig-like domain-containing protein [Paludibacteraceae bacterium]
MNKAFKLGAIGLLCGLLGALTACNEEPEYAQSVVKTIDKNGIVLVAGETYSAAVAGGENLTWTSDKEAVAAVSAEGLVTAVGPGKATIKALNGETEVLSVKVQVLAKSSFTLFENGKVLLSVAIDSCMDAWYDIDQYDGDDYYVMHNLLFYTKTISSDGAGWVIFPDNDGKTVGAVVEIPLSFVQPFYGEYPGLPAGQYRIQHDSYDFDYKFVNANDVEGNWDWVYAYWNYSTNYYLDLQKTGDNYSVKYTGVDDYKRQWQLLYSGKMTEQ